jgi:hypothetical protein
MRPDAPHVRLSEDNGCLGVAPYARFPRRTFEIRCRTAPLVASARRPGPGCREYSRTAVNGTKLRRQRERLAADLANRPIVRAGVRSEALGAEAGGSVEGISANLRKAVSVRCRRC